MGEEGAPTALVLLDIAKLKGPMSGSCWRETNWISTQAILLVLFQISLANVLRTCTRTRTFVIGIIFRRPEATAKRPSSLRLLGITFPEGMQATDNRRTRNSWVHATVLDVIKLYPKPAPRFWGMKRTSSLYPWHPFGWLHYMPTYIARRNSSANSDLSPVLG